MRKPRPPVVTRDRAPGKPEGRRQTLSAPGGSERGVGMTVSKSCPPGPISRAARSPGRGLALPPLQSSGGSLHYRGSDGGRVCTGSEQALQSAAAAAGPCRIQEESSRLQRLVDLPPSKAQGGVRACLRVRVCARAPTRMCPPTQACSYLLAAAATGAMAAKDAEPADRHPHGGTAARSRARRTAIEGPEARKPLSLMLITELP